MAETFRLLEEALHSHYGIKMALTAESARPAAEAHVRSDHLWRPLVPHYARRVDGNARCYTGIHRELPQRAPAKARTLSRIADVFRTNAHPNYPSGKVLHSR